MKIKILIPVLIYLFTSCESTNIDKDQSFPLPELSGSWYYNEYSGSSIVYHKNKAFEEDKYSITFNNDYTLTEHKNIGWCGTPPVVYGDYNGTWTYNEEFIEIYGTFWGGDLYQQWQIVELTENRLEVNIVFDTLYLQQ